jgi:hypothetical protein
LSPWFGIRADLVAAGTYGVQNDTNLLLGFSGNLTGRGIGLMAHITMYFNLTERLTLQVGAKGGFALHV